MNGMNKRNDFIISLNIFDDAIFCLIFVKVHGLEVAQLLSSNLQKKEEAKSERTTF